MYEMLQRIRQTAAAISKTQDAERQNIEKITSKLAAHDNIYLVGSGSSYHAAHFGELLFGKIGLSTKANVASEFIEHTQLTGDDAVIIISVSGTKKDAISILDKAKNSGCYTVSIVNNKDSPIIPQSSASIIPRTGIPHGFINTKEYLAQLFCLAMLSKELGCDIPANEINSLPKVLSKTINDSESKIAKLAVSLGDKNRFLFMGEGIPYVTALQSSLKLKEVVYSILYSEALHSDELPHGRIFSVANSDIVIFPILCNEERYTRDVMDLLTKMNPESLIIPTAFDRSSIISTERVADPLLPILQTSIFYLFTFYSALTRGIDPNQPKNVDMVKTQLYGDKG